MTVLTILGALLLIAGAFLIGFGVQKTQTLTDKVVEGFTGRYTKKTIWALIGGGLLLLFGIFLIIYAGWTSPSL